MNRRLLANTLLATYMLVPMSMASAQRPGIYVPWGGNGIWSKFAKQPVFDLTAISVQGHTLAITSDRTVLAWGPDTQGQCDVPEGLGDVLKVSAASGHSLALRTSGEVVAWGSNVFGESTVPVGLHNVTAIAAAPTFCLAVSNGAVVGWGERKSGQLAIPDAAKHDVASVAAGLHTALALHTDGTVIGWGNNVSNQLDIPPNLSRVKAIAMGASNCLALKEDGTVVSWGTTKTTPAGLSDVVAIATGGKINMALKSDGTVVYWGEVYWGDGLAAPPLRGIVAIATDGERGSALATSHLFAEPEEIVGGTKDALTTVFATEDAKSTATTIVMQSTNAAVEVPSSVSLAAQKRIVAIPVKHHPVPNSTAVTLTATFDGSDYTDAVFLSPFRINYFKITSRHVSSTQPVTATLTLSATPSEELTLTLGSSYTALVHVPATLTVPAGQKQVQFQITSDPTFLRRASSTITAQYGTLSPAWRHLMVDPDPYVMKLNLQSRRHGNHFIGGETIGLLAVLNVRTRTATTVGLMTSDGALGTVPVSVNIAPGTSTVLFDVATSVVDSPKVLQIRAQIGTGPVGTREIDLYPAGALKNVEVPNLPLYGSQEVTATVNLFARNPGSIDATVETDPSIIGPGTVTLPAGALTKTFKVQTKDVDHLTIAPVTVKYGASQVTINVRIRPCFVQSVMLSNSDLAGGESCTATVQLTNTVAEDTPVKVSIGRALLASVPGTVIVPAGSSTATFTVTALHFKRTLSTQILATRHGKNKTADLRVHP